MEISKNSWLYRWYAFNTSAFEPKQTNLCNLVWHCFIWGPVKWLLAIVVSSLFCMFVFTVTISIPWDYGIYQFGNGYLGILLIDSVYVVFFGYSYYRHKQEIKEENPSLEPLQENKVVVILKQRYSDFKNKTCTIVRFKD